MMSPGTGTPTRSTPRATFFKVDIPENSKASEVKDFVARELHMSPYTFKLLLGLKKTPVWVGGFHRFTKDFRYLNWWY